jgi:hypothetical protein
MTVLLNSNENHMSLIHKYFLPLLANESPTAFIDVWKKMAKNVMNQENAKGINGLLLCLNVATSTTDMETDRISGIIRLM